MRVGDQWELCHRFQTKLVQKAMNEKRFDEAVKLRGG